MTTPPLHPRPAGLGRRFTLWTLAGLTLGVAVAVALPLAAPKRVSANAALRVDSDADGLTDLQEALYGTAPDRRDSDLDGYTDLEELARGSDPINYLRTPTADGFGLRVLGTAEDGILSMASALFVPGGDLAAIDVKHGVVIGEEVFWLTADVYRSTTRAFLHRGADPADRIVLIEMAIPERLVRVLGQISFFTVVRNLGDPPSAGVIQIANLIDVGGVTVIVEDPPDTMTDPDGGQGPPTGIVYRPLSEGSSLPASWSAGEICWQKTSPAGMSGPNLLFEVDAASCEPLDTYCSPSDCQASVGGLLQMPDPTALLGG